MATWKWINIGSSNGLLPGGTKPLQEPTFTYESIFYESSEGNCIRDTSRIVYNHLSKYSLEEYEATHCELISRITCKLNKHIDTCIK